MEQQDHIIISELLSFMACNLNIYEKPLLLKTVKSYYSDDVITDALDILILSMPTKIYEGIKEKTKHDAACSLYNYLSLIPQNEMPLFVCRDLNNLPNVISDELETKDNQITSIRNQQKNMKCKIKEISESIKLIKNQVQSMVHRAIKHHLNDTELSDIALSKNEPNENVAYLQQLLYKDMKEKEIGLKDIVDKSSYRMKTEQNDIIIENNEEDDSFEVLFPPDNLNGIPNHRTLKFESEDGHLLMTTSDDPMNFDDIPTSNTENLHKFEITEDSESSISNVGKQDTMPIKDLEKQKPSFIIVDSCYDETIGNYLLYRCYRCSYSSNDEMSASKHDCSAPSTSQYKTYTYTCNFCSFKSSDVTILNNHLSMHNTIEPDEAYECVLCYFKSGDQNEYKNHLSTHSWKKPFKCSLCSYKGYDEYRMKCHSLKHAEFKSEYEYECQICLKICGTFKALKRHKMLHARKYDYQCQYCNITYKNKSTLANHVLSHTKEKSFSCSYCNRICDSKYTLFMHEKVHFRVQTYSCTVCNMQFKNRNTRHSHIITKHPDLKPFKCKICDASFAFQQSYLVHKNGHNENKNRKVSCPYCSKKFKTIGYMKMHVGWIHQGSKPFKCSVCDFQSRLKSDVNKHEAEHRVS